MTRPPATHDTAATFAGGLLAHATRLALVAGDRELGYAELADQVAAAAERLGGRNGARRLVVLEASNELEPLVLYLAALQAGHPVLFLPGGSGPALRSLVDVYDPDVVVTRESGWAVEERRPGSIHELHPDLALLLSTSGSTGSPKLVRLSHENLRSNADAIRTYLGLTADDRAVTSLPMAYCYGLSVINSHLTAGAGLVLTGRSVVDDDFWLRFRAHRATSLAGVPHTFELLDRIGFGEMRLPSLRYVSQAGGRLDPATVQRFAVLGQRRGWDLYVMYGQTEATARMAYLPPGLARSHPGTIGIAVPGGALRIESVAGADDGVGELVYRGPNVMLGYAHGPLDLAVGRTVDELRTGDLARRRSDGLFEIVGRRSRFVKPFGLRIDLDQVERTMRARGLDAVCAGDDEHIVVATTARRPAAVVHAVRAQVGLPASMVHVHPVPVLPRLPTGKPDHAGVLALGRTDTALPDPAAGGAVAALYADVLARRSVPAEATFVALGGDSLSYVEASVRLEDLIGAVPDGWPRMPVAELDAVAGRHATRGAGAPAATGMDTTVVLRAASIVLVVANHAGLAALKGGAHLLLAVAGWNFARFQLPVSWARLSSSLARVVLPTLACIGVLLLATDDYGVSNLALVHTQFGSTTWDQRWRFWFVEALVQILVVVGGLASVPALRRLEARFPFGFATALVAATVVLRELTEVARTFHRPQTVVWLFALGWAAQRATTGPRKLVVALVAIAAVHGFFHDATREGVVIVGVLLLIARARLPMLAIARRGVAAVASASLFVYLTHWHVYPAVRAVSSPGAAVVASLVVGVALASGWRRAAERLRTYRTAAAGRSLRLARWGG